MKEKEEAAPEIDPRKRNSAVLCAVVAALASLPLCWMTLHDVEVTSRGNELTNELFSGIGGLLPRTMQLTALQGHLFGGALPLWGLSLLVVLANLVLLVRRAKQFYVPEALPLVLALAAMALMLVPLLVAGSAKATLGPGWLLCFAASLVPVVYLFRERALVVAWREARRKHEREQRRAAAQGTLANS